MSDEQSQPSDAGAMAKRRRPMGPLVSAAARIIVLLGLLVALPINNTVEYAYFDRIVGPLGMLWGADGLLVLALAGSWYGFLWRRLDKKAYPAIRQSRLLIAIVAWAALAYAFLWWVISCASGLADSAECTAIALLAVASPTLAYYLTVSIMTSLERWRKGEGVFIGSWLRSQRRPLLTTGAIVVVLGLAFWFLWAGPRLRLTSLPRDMDKAEARSACHRVLWLPGWQGKAIDGLHVVGDESSVPRIIRAMWWVREQSDHPAVRTQWSYANALRWITNHDAGETYSEWREWYALNRGKSQTEWIASGFAVDGLPVTAEPSVPSARALLAVLGEDDHWTWETPYWRLLNAWRLLATYDLAIVDRALDEVIREGNAPEKRGATRYIDPDYARERASHGISIDTSTVEHRLKTLAKDADRSVRLVADAAYSRIRLKSLQDITKAVKVQDAPRGGLVGGRPESGVLYLRNAQDKLIAYDLARKTVLWEVGIYGGITEPMLDVDGDMVFVTRGGRLYRIAPDGTLRSTSVPEGERVVEPVVGVDGDLVFATWNGKLYRVAPDGTLRWTSSLELKPKEGISKGPVRAGNLILVGLHESGPGRYGGNWSVSAHSLEDGRETGRADGKMLFALGSRVVTVDNRKVRVVTLPGLALQAEFNLDGRPFSATLTGETLCLVTVINTLNAYGSDDTLCVEGWSLETGKQLYKRTIAEIRIDHGATLFDPDDGILYLPMERLVVALRPEDGTAAWEMGIIGTRSMSVVDEFLVVRGYKSLTFLNRRTGELRASYSTEGGSRAIVRIGNSIYATDSPGGLFEFAMPAAGGSRAESEAR